MFCANILCFAPLHLGPRGLRPS